VLRGDKIFISLNFGCVHGFVTDSFLGPDVFFAI